MFTHSSVEIETDVLRAATGDLAHSQSLLGHKKRDMTVHYVRRHSGQRVKPLR